MPLPAIGMPGPFELVVIFLIVLLLFGAGRVTQVFEAFGKGLRSFRDAQKEGELEGDRPKELPPAEVQDAQEVRKD